MAPPADVRDERADRGLEPFRLGVAQRHERAAASLDEEHRLTVEQDDPRSGDPGRAGARSLRPGKPGTIGLRRVRSGEHERLGLVVLRGTQFPQALDRTGQGELGSTEPFDEVAAAAHAERLEHLQLGIHRAVAAPDPLAAHAVAGDDPLALEQQLGEGAAIRRRREQRRRERPPTLRRRRGRPPRP